MKKLITCAVMAAVLAGLSFGQTSPPPRPGNYVEQSRPELKTEVITIKFLDATWIQNLIRPYVSRYGKIQFIPRTNKIVVEDTPEIIEKIVNIIAEVDVKPLDLQFDVDLILGISGPEEGEDLTRIKKLEPVLKELQGLTRYKNFRVVDSSIIKVQDNSRSRNSVGGDGQMFKLQLEPHFISQGQSGSIQVELSLSQTLGFNEDGTERSRTLIDTTLTLKSGEKTVVGVSNLPSSYIGKDQRVDKALIMILSGKVLK